MRRGVDLFNTGQATTPATTASLFQGHMRSLSARGHYAQGQMAERITIVGSTLLQIGFACRIRLEMGTVAVSSFLHTSPEFLDKSPVHAHRIISQL